MSSFKEIVDQIMEDTKGRFKNPLILSFILVWVYYHWSIVYIVITFNNAIPVNSRLSVFKEYVKAQEQTGMLWKPLFFSFISLAVFYLLGVAAQYIKLWLGKRLSAEMLAKYDKGKFEEKAVVEKIRSELKKMKGEKEVLETELESTRTKLRQKDAEFEETESRNEEKVAEKDLEYGKLNARYSDLTIQNSELADKLEKEHRSSNELREQLRALMNKEIDLNTEIDKLKLEGNKFRSTQDLFNQIALVDSKEPYGHLTLDTHNVLTIIFGNIKWDVIDEFGNTTETFYYERGFFLSANREFLYKITNVTFEDDTLIFLKHYFLEPGVTLSESVVKLKIDNKHELFGTEDGKNVKYIHSRFI